MRTVTRRGVTWEVDAPDSVTPWFWDEWEAERWEPYTLDIVDQFVRPGSTMVDVGAWIGPVTMWATRLGAYVVAVEPDPVARDYLHRNITSNGFADQVDVTDMAVSNECRSVVLYPDEKEGWGCSMTRTRPDTSFDLRPTERRIMATTLSYLFDPVTGFDIQDCSLVKMDIEGGEAYAMPDAGPFCAAHGIPMLVAMHEPWWSVVKRVTPAHFRDFSHVIGDIAGWGQVLAIP